MKKYQWTYITAALFTANFLAGCVSGRSEDSQTSGGENSSLASSITDATGGNAASLPLSDISALAAASAQWDEETAAIITLDGDSAKISGNGAVVKGSAIEITQAGVYVLRGTMTDGQILINAGKEDLVQLVLDGAALSCSNSAPIYAKQSGRTVITLADQSENTVTDGFEYLYASGEDEPDAAIFCKDDLILNGTGSLTVQGNYNNGIGCKDHLVITGGNITVTAVNDAIRGRDSVTVSDGTLSLAAQGDGIQSNNDTDTEKGWIHIEGGQLDITAGHDGIQAETALVIDGGEIQIVSGGGSKSSQQLSGTSVSAEETSDSYKGVKSGASLLINSGTLKIDSLDDAIHTNGDATIQNGDLTLATGDDGIHADGALVINGGIIFISESYEGLEGASVDVNGGDITLTASDDGMNAAGGSDGETGMGRMGSDSFHAPGGTESGSSYYIRFTGGVTKIDASGDGIDSNGNLYIEGGTVLVDGPVNNGNGALDYDGSCTVTGGILMAAGSSGMAQSPSENSTQSSLTVYYSSIQKAGSAVILKDGSGNTVAAHTPSKDYQSVIISAPDIKQGETYLLYADKMLLTKITISNMITRVSDDGSEAGGNMMDGGNRLGRGGSAPDGAFTPPEKDSFRENGAFTPPEGGSIPMENGGIPEREAGGRNRKSPDDPTQSSTQ